MIWILFIILLVVIIFREEIKTMIAFVILLSLIWYGGNRISEWAGENWSTIVFWGTWVIVGVVAAAALYIGLRLEKRQFNRRSRENYGLLPNSNKTEPSHTAASQPREDYSEYRCEGFVVRDHRVGRDYSPEGEEGR